MDNQTEKKNPGPKNPVERRNRRDEVYSLYFEKCLPAVQIAKNLGVSRNTIDSDIKFLLNSIGKVQNSSDIRERYIKQIEILENQRGRLLQCMENEDIENKIKIEKIIADNTIKSAKLISNIIVNNQEQIIISKQEFDEVIRKICYYDDKKFTIVLEEREICKRILFITKRNQSYAEKFYKRMKSEGLDYFFEFIGYNVFDFACFKGIISKSEEEDFNQKISDMIKEEDR